MGDERTRAGLPPGYDDSDPYEDEDLSSYPDWWRKLIEEFEEHGMRAYRPPRFSNGGLVPEVVMELEEALDSEIRIRARNPAVGDDWEVTLGNRSIGQIGRYRDGDGYTVYEIDEEEFRALVRENAASTAEQ